MCAVVITYDKLELRNASLVNYIIVLRSADKDHCIINSV